MVACTIEKVSISFWRFSNASNYFIPYYHNQVNYTIVNYYASKSFKNDDLDKSAICGIVNNNDIVEIKITLDNEEEYSSELDNSNLFIIDYYGNMRNFKKIEGLNESGNVIWGDYW